MAQKPMLRLELLDGGLAVSTEGFVGGDMFTFYKSTCQSLGARFNRSAKAWVLPMEQASRVVRHLKPHFTFTSSNTAAVNAAIKQAKKDAEHRVSAGLKRAGELGLYGYQVDGVRWLSEPEHRVALLGDEMGLGKTVQALMAMPEGHGAVVIAPANVKGKVVEDNGTKLYLGTWPREIKKWRPELEPVVLSGRMSPEDWVWPKPNEVFIINYDILPETRKKANNNRYEYLVDAPRSSNVTLIVDEAHYCKNHKAQRTRKVSGLVALVRSSGGCVWPMTGTPMTRNPMDLWNVLRTAGLEKRAFGSWPNFLRLFGGWRPPFGGIEFNPAAVERNSEEIAACLQNVMLRRKRSVVLPDLPKKTRELHDVDVFGDVRRLKKVLKDLGITWDVEETRKLADDYAEWLGDQLEIGEDSTPAEIEAAMDVLNKSEVDFESMSAMRKGLAICKIPALLDEIVEYEEQDEPVVVFSAHRKPVEILGQREGWEIIVGGLDSGERGRIENDFQAGKLKGVALTIGAGREGLTLTRASHMLFVDQDWSPQLNAQAEDRICRISQESDKALYKILVSDHVVDRHVANIVKAKTRMADASVHAAEVARPEFSDRRSHEEITAAATTKTKAKPSEPKATGGEPKVEMTETTPEQAKRQRESERRSKFRQAESRLENWAKRALIHLADSDPDRAREENEMGFNRLDGEIGHSLAEQLDRFNRLSDKQWSLAVKICRKYHRQVGPPPEGEEDA